MVGVLGALLFGLVLIFGETQGARGGAIMLIAISLALVAGGVFGLRRRPKPREEPAARRGSPNAWRVYGDMRRECATRSAR